MAASSRPFLLFAVLGSTALGGCGSCDGGARPAEQRSSEGEHEGGTAILTHEWDGGSQRIDLRPRPHPIPARKP